MADRQPHVVIVVVNLPAERDRRVIRECRALESAGYRATVICPRGPARPTVLPGTAGTAIRSFPQPLAGTGVLSFALEFAWALTAVAVRLLALMLRTRVDAVQVCNPPDIFWPLALLVRAVGRPFVFDHHDLSPELYECKTDRPHPAVLRILRLCERLSWRCASAVVATNESYRQLAVTRGGCHPDRVVVVRNGPTLAEVGSGPPAHAEPAGLIPSPRAESGPVRRTIVYLGVINPQDHVETAVLAAEELARRRGRTDWRLVVAGDGESLPELRRLSAERGIDDVVEFTGWLEADEVDGLLRTATLAVQPDPPTRMAQLSTMAKTVEYVARGLPVVAVDLLETRRTAGEAARYVPNGTPDELAGALDTLLDDAPTRAEMSRVARDRFTDSLAWDHQERAYLALWQRLLTGTAAAPTTTDRKATRWTSSTS
ncbi:glycosyltransferase family 4 protein [Micromonospora echinofusca]|uniref:Glycosyltransferase n=1 Tax=Micromonospora echinofusca TaxID=47858 RepID=A0ABS3VL44_MICEH|nr:glycosyltransferase family 4 protein [Micromonospora echinofusca]MBO4205222.1 glycosyltransferase [Micromonospora echinofusca]